MQVIDFAGDDALTIAAFKIRDLKPREACIFHSAPSTPAPMQAKLIRRAIARSSRVIWTLTDAETSDPQFISQIFALDGLYAVSVELHLTPRLRIQHTGRNSSGDPALLERWRRLREQFGERLQVIPEVSLNGDLDYLGPTLMELAASKPPWIILRPDAAPDPGRLELLKRTFEYLEMRDFPLTEIHFSFHRPHSRAWKLLSGCFFSGPEDAHIDISNKCTHSCIFCALYAPDVVQEFKDQNGGSINENTKRFMSAQLPFEKAQAIIESLPIAARAVQFGGAGDPMTHPRALELIALARERGFCVEVLTNMEYFKPEDLEKLNSLGGSDPQSLRIIANVSAATPETYVLTRPRQTAATFAKVVANIKELTRLREAAGGYGVHVDLMCVTNRHNYHEASKFVTLAKEVGARRVWFKPIEVHHRYHYDLLPPKEEQPRYKRALKEAFALADRLGVVVEQRLKLKEDSGEEAIHV